MISWVERFVVRRDPEDWTDMYLWNVGLSSTYTALQSRRQSSEDSNVRQLQKN
jgi:hypothetical protein